MTVLENVFLVVDITSNDERDKIVFILLTKYFLIGNLLTWLD